tara:strand:+ start:194 stop:457 length:264 start_codon:yes stop_codon:yes gene_type:complete
MGFGYWQCGDFLNYMDEDNTANSKAVTVWVQGYITGRNDEAINRVGDGKVNLQGTRYALENYCRKNPLNDIWDGARKIYEDLGGDPR